KSTRELLQASGFLDESGSVIAKDTLLIFDGDIINKGENSVETLDFLMRTAAKAEQAGCQLIVTLGNHEAELLSDPKKTLKDHPELARSLGRNRLRIGDL